MVASPEQQVRAFVDAVCAAHISHDFAVLKTILADDSTVVLGLGQVFDRRQYIAALEYFDTTTMKPTNLRVDLLAEEQIAVCTGVFEYLARHVPQQTDYERVDIFHTMVWSRQAGDWRLLLMQATRIPSRNQP